MNKNTNDPKQEVIVYLRGLVRESGHWNPFFEYARKAMPDVLHISPDIPGAGERYLEATPANLTEIVKEAREYLKKMPQFSKNSTDKKFHLVAVSMGGMLALEWARLFPDEIKSLYLMNTSVKGITPILHRLKPYGLKMFIKCFLTPNVLEREKLMISLVCSTQKARDKIQPIWFDLQQKHPVSRSNSLRQFWAAFRFDCQKLLPGDDNQKMHQIPKIFVAAKGDDVCDYRSSIRLQKKLGGEVEIHQWAGHNLADDDPDYTVNSLRAWLSQIK